MGTGKKERSRLARQGKSGSGMDNIKIKGENFYRSAKKIKTLNMRKDEGKPVRNADGKIIQAAKYQSRDVPSARVEPNRKWFTNTRVISQDSLKAFREAMDEKAKDPYQVLLKTNKIPMSLIRDNTDTKNGLKQHKAKMTIESAPFADAFGPKSQRKRVKLDVSSLTDLAEDTEKSMDAYKDRLEQARLLSGNSGAAVDPDGLGEGQTEGEDALTMAIEPIFNKGQSKRIWNELYKVLDASDVIIHVLDARDPLGTRCRSVEKYLREEAPHKHLIFVLNKTDLVPTSVAAAWVRKLSADFPTLAFHSSITNPFGKGSLIQLLRQFSQLHSDRKQISVGLIGYPNVGKSSIINTLRKKKVAKVAPIPGETKVWQYVTLMKRIYLIDCPGVVPPNQNDTPQDILLRGVVRVEMVENPEQYIPALLAKVKQHHMERTYEIKGWNDHIHFLELLARKGGRLLKAGEPDVDGVAKMVLNDFMRGKIPWFTPAPIVEGEEGKTIEGREGRLGEMPKKRKRDDLESVPDTTAAPSTTSLPEGVSASEDEEFEGFGSNNEESSDDEAEVDDDDDEDDMIPLDELSDIDESGASDDSEDEG
ncbi:nucleolar GTP-binding protein [Hypoxylon trugodes]|uniref:nucleolar GTP-binding protein n=1 Tax=Hypoxylon trugodes TaxID=326681 RepID=UPI0021A1B294|nr:nucleolar GTP-binding protein [Hypoxylon trugodes]KAI1393015.1 nucleolar GTP-binding protein [Hypoxylon trugodes]